MNRGAIRSNRTRFAFILIFMLLTAFTVANHGGTAVAALTWAKISGSPAPAPQPASSAGSARRHARAGPRPLEGCCAR